MGQWLEVLYDVLFHPKSAMREISERQLIGQSLIVFVLSVVLPGIALLPALADSPLAIVAVGLYITGSLVLWLAGTAILHFIAELYGGRGTATGLFAAFGFSQLPRLLMAPLWLVTALFSDSIRALVTGTGSVVVILWILALHMKALEAGYGFSPVKAILVLATPFLACSALALMTVVFVAGRLLPWS